MDRLTSAFGVLLKRFRGRAGLTQEALAERSGLSLQTITKLERGAHRRPRSETVHVLASALHLVPQERAYLERAVLLDARAEQPIRGDDLSSEDRLPTIDMILRTLAALPLRRPTLIDVFVSACPDEVSALDEDTIRVTIL